jgi:hypothetical protein
VSYVWAGIGCTFSVVVLFSLFWRKFHGKAAIITVLAGMIFTMVWISGGFEQHYRVTENKINLLVSQGIVTGDEPRDLMMLDGQRFVNKTKFESAIRNEAGITGDDRKIAVISSSCTQKGVPARLTTFIFSLLVAVGTTYLVRPGKR